MNNSEWQDIQAIHMSIQSVDLHNIGIKMDRELRISCGLINIARGQCNLRICPSDSKNINQKIGNLHISADRPVMTAEITMPYDLFNDISAKLKLQFSRPATIVLLIADNLFVNLAGDLNIKVAKDITIRDISWIFPIQ